MASPDSRLLAQSSPISHLHADDLWGKGRRCRLEAPAFHSGVTSNIAKETALSQDRSSDGFVTKMGFKRLVKFNTHKGNG